MKGIGYQSFRTLRIGSGIPKSKIEKEGYERYSLYFARSHQEDHETGQVSRGHLKFGRAKFITALQRGRNEGGADFRIYGEIVLDSNEATKEFEARVQSMMSRSNRTGSQGQRELYDIRDSELENVILEVARVLRTYTHHRVLEVNLYENDRRMPVAL